MPRVIFFGTPELAATVLNALIEDDTIDVVGVVTPPDRPQGRKLRLQPSPVKQRALEAGVEVDQPERPRGPKFLGRLEALQPDVIAVAAYGHILPKNLLDLPTHGCLNVHTSILPRYRGAAPIQWALLNGDAETGVTIMKMDAGMDTGDILSIETTQIQSHDDAQSLHDRLAQIGAGLLVQTLPRYLTGELPGTPQPETGVSYARKIEKVDGRVPWTDSATVIHNRIRALTPWPGCFTTLPDAAGDPTLKIWEAQPIETNPDSQQSAPPGTVIRVSGDGLEVACGTRDAALRLTTIQAPGSRRMNARDYLAGHPLPIGSRLGG